MFCSTVCTSSSGRRSVRALILFLLCSNVYVGVTGMEIKADLPPGGT